MMALIPGTYVLAAVFKHRGLPFGIYFTSAALGGVAGPFMVFGIMRLAHDHWRDFWMTQMVAALVVGVICSLMVGGTAALQRASEETDLEVAAEAAAPNLSGVYRTVVDWTAREAVRTPQFYILLAAYFGHLLIGVTVAGTSVAHLTQRGVNATIAGTMLSIEALMQIAGRSLGGLVGDRIDPRYLMMAALACLAVGSAALGVAKDYPTMLIYAVGSGVGFGLTLLTVTVLLLNYFGRQHNLAIFSLTCLIGAVSALGPTIGGSLRDLTGGFSITFQLFAGVIAVILLAVVFMRPPRHALAAQVSADLAAHLAQDPALEGASTWQNLPNTNSASFCRSPTAAGSSHRPLRHWTACGSRTWPPPSPPRMRALISSCPWASGAASAARPTTGAPRWSPSP